MGKPGEFSVTIKADELELELNRIAGDAEEAFNAALGDLASATYARIVASAQEKLHSTGKEYLQGLSFDKISDNHYVISLEGRWQEKLEAGFPGYSMKDTLLKSDKILETGGRAGQPWVQTSKKGHKYAHVPMEKKPFSKAPGATDLGALIQGLKAPNAKGRMQNFTSVFKDKSGSPMQGKVAVAQNTGVKDLEGLVKYQKTYTKDNGKQTTQSLYVLYRTISENPEANSDWNHPGWSGLKAFPEAEEYLERELENLLRYFAE